MDLRVQKNGRTDNSGCMRPEKLQRLRVQIMGLLSQVM